MTAKDKRIIDKALLVEASMQSIIRLLVHGMKENDDVLQVASNAFQELQEEVIYGESVDDYAD